MTGDWAGLKPPQIVFIGLFKKNTGNPWNKAHLVSYPAGDLLHTFTFYHLKHYLAPIGFVQV